MLNILLLEHTHSVLPTPFSQIDFIIYHVGD